MTVGNKPWLGSTGCRSAGSEVDVDIEVNSRQENQDKGRMGKHEDELADGCELRQFKLVVVVVEGHEFGDHVLVRRTK